MRRALGVVAALLLGGSLLVGCGQEKACAGTIIVPPAPRPVMPVVPVRPVTPVRPMPAVRPPLNPVPVPIPVWLHSSPNTGGC